MSGIDERMYDMLTDDDFKGLGTRIDPATEFIWIQRLGTKEKPITSKGVATMFAQLPPTIRTLQIHYAYFTKTAEPALAKGIGDSAITKLILWECKTISCEGLAGIIRSLPKSTIHLGVVNGVPEQGGEGSALWLKEIPSRIRFLEIPAMELGNPGGIALAKNIPVDLQELNIDYNKIGKAGATALAAALPPPSMLTPNNLKDWEMGNEEYLEVEVNPVYYPEKEWPVNVARWRDWKGPPADQFEWDLGYTRLSISECREFGKYVPQTLTSLNIDYSLFEFRCGDAPFALLLPSLPPTLEVLSIDECKLSGAGYTSLAKQLPKLPNLNYLSMACQDSQPDRNDGLSAIFKSAREHNVPLKTIKLSMVFLEYQQLSPMPPTLEIFNNLDSYVDLGDEEVLKALAAILPPQATRLGLGFSPSELANIAPLLPSTLETILLGQEVSCKGWGEVKAKLPSGVKYEVLPGGHSPSEDALAALPGLAGKEG